MGIYNDYIKKYGMKSLIYFQTTTAALLKLGTRVVILSHILLAMWSLIHSESKSRGR